MVKWARGTITLLIAIHIESPMAYCFGVEGFGFFGLRISEKFLIGLLQWPRVRCLCLDPRRV